MTTRRSFLAGSTAAIIAGAAPRPAWAKTEADVAIIGAGLAGLNAAMLCEAAGLSVIVLEGENRIGGRLHTLDDLPGKPEAGGIQVGAGYARLHTIARQLGVSMSSDAAGAGAGRVSSPGNLYWINGKRSVAADWASLPPNPLDGASIGTEPAQLLRKYAGAFPRFEQVADWLTADPLSDLPTNLVLLKAGASREALRLIEANLNGNSLSSMSQLHLARSFAIFRAGAGAVSTITGGAQRLPEAMAGALKTEVRLGCGVEQIIEEPEGVTIRLAGAAQKSVTARRAICTVPFAALGPSMIQASLPPALAFSMAHLPYTHASFAYLTASEPFWRGDAYPDTIWSDDPLIGRIFVLSDGNDGSPPMLKLWTTGAGADMLDRMRRDRAEAEIMTRIARIRPSSAGKLKLARLYSWQRMPGARGIYHHIGAGMAAPHAHACQTRGANLHFAGEHLAIENSGMEGALESGERAAKRVIQLSS